MSNNKTQYFLIFDDGTQKELVWTSSSSGSDGTRVFLHEMSIPPKPLTLTAAALRAIADKMDTGDRAQLPDGLEP